MRALKPVQMATKTIIACFSACAVPSAISGVLSMCCQGMIGSQQIFIKALRIKIQT